MSVLYVGNSLRVLLDNLRLGSDASAVNDGVVTAELLNSAGTLVTNSDITLAYIAASVGDYAGTLPATLALTAGQIYTLNVTATSGGLTYLTTSKITATEREA